MSSPTTPFETQNVGDDDGPVIDSFFVETDKAPPAPLDSILIPAKAEPPILTRVLAGTEVINPGTDAFQLLPADPTRVETEIDVIWEGEAGTETVTDYVNVGGDLGPVSNAGMAGSRAGAYRIYPGSGGRDFDAHNGPLYIGPAFGQTGPLVVTWRAVTK
jgi:hypothetical protein